MSAVFTGEASSSRRDESVLCSLLECELSGELAQVYAKWLMEDGGPKGASSSTFWELQSCSEDTGSLPEALLVS